MGSRRSVSASLVICGTLALTGRAPKTLVRGRRSDYRKLRDAAADTADDAKSTEMDGSGAWEAYSAKVFVRKVFGMRLFRILSMILRMP